MKDRKYLTSASDFKTYEHAKHIYEVPDMYIGSDEKTERQTYIYKKGKIVSKTISLPEGMERLYIEVLTNAADNAGKSRRHDIDPSTIEIYMDEHLLSIKNYGIGIPVEKGKKGIYAPESIFGTLLTSSHYEEDRHEAGRNGLGVKLVNIFSKKLNIEVIDSERQLSYKQKWTKNMNKREDPIVEDTSEDKSSVLVKWKLDFQRFGYDQYPKEAFHLFKRHACDISFSSKVKIKFNEEMLNYTDILKYKDLFFDPSLKSTLYYSWEFTDTFTEEDIKKKKNGIQEGKRYPRVELCLVDSPRTYISFVNGIMTPEGGPHVDAALEAYAKPLVDHFNKNIEKGNKSRFRIPDVKQHMSLIISVRVKNPKFTSQNKTKLSSPKIPIKLDRDILPIFRKWDLFSTLKGTLQVKELKLLKDSDGKKAKHVYSNKGVDANEAGGRESSKCRLYIFEGDSAKSYFTSMVKYIDGGYKYSGTLPIKGKLLNVMNASVRKQAENEELNEIKKLLGLKEELDYTKNKDYRTLRYGSIVIMADSDDDGKHIVALIINFFVNRFPSLVEREFIYFFRTPIIRVHKGSKNKRFLTMGEYMKWTKNTDDWKSWKHRYLKGLASSNKIDVKDDANHDTYVKCIGDPETEESISLAFNKDRSDDRKDWIANWELVYHKFRNNIKISTFLCDELIEYSVANLRRSIPRMIDGLKTSSRKALWASYLRWKWHTNKNHITTKTCIFSSYAHEQTNYHHGPSCLSKTIVNMTQNFVGSNNLPYFVDDGQFGTRAEGGKDAGSDRYSFLGPERWLHYVYPQDDFPIMDFVMDEGKYVEPVTFYPIIPMILVNGGRGIGSGSSTFIPCCHPHKLVKWLKRKLGNKETKEIKPWYKGFTGRLYLEHKKGVKIDGDLIFDNDSLLSETINDEEKEEIKNNSGGITMITEGKYNILDKETIHIDELPIGRWYDPYRKWLESLHSSKKLKDFKHNCNADDIDFTLHGFESNGSISSLKLRKSYSLNNMTLLDIDNHPHKYSTLGDIIEEFYTLRLQIYDKRKEYKLKVYSEDLNKIDMKIRFIMAYLNGEILINNRKKVYVEEDMKKLNIDTKLLGTTHMGSLTEDELNKLNKEYNNLTDKINNLKDKDIKDMWLEDLNLFEKEYLDVYY